MIENRVGNPKWKKGQSGNPAGRPVGIGKDIMRNSKAKDFTMEVMLGTQNKFYQVVDNVLTKAVNGDKFYESIVTRDLAKYYMVQPKIDVEITKEPVINEEMSSLMKDATTEQLVGLKPWLKEKLMEYLKKKTEA